MKLTRPTKTVSLFLPICAAVVSLLAVTTSCRGGSSDDAASSGAGGQVTLGLGDDDAIVQQRSSDSSGGTMGEGGRSAADAVPSLKLCDTAAGYSVSQAAGDAVLDDFEDGDAQSLGNGRVGYWYTYGDGTGTILPDGEASPSGPGHDSDYALHVVAKDFSYWGSGVGTGFASDGTQDCLEDLSVYTGVSFWVRGSVTAIGESGVERDQGAVSLLLIESDVAPVEEGGGCSGETGGCWDAHRVRFIPDQCWQLVALDFSEFEQDGWGQDGGELDLKELYRMNFQVAAYNDSDIWVDDISFYSGKKPTADPDCQMGGEGGAGAQ